jgi:hypothetical protein
MELNGKGFYVEQECCTNCGVPHVIAPDLVGWRDEQQSHCEWIKQPETPDEIDRAIKILHTQELDCHRYAGDDPSILERSPAQCCDHLHPVKPIRTGPFLTPSGPTPNFQLPGSSPGHHLLAKLWRKLTRQN